MDRSSLLARRQFLVAAGLVMVGAGQSAPRPAWAQTAAANKEDSRNKDGATKRDAAALIVGKDKRLLVLGESPVVLETPLALLRENSLTPLELLFVRNNQSLAEAATMAALPLRGWKIELSGLINRPLTINAAELLVLDQVEHEMVLQCSGNSRSLFAASAAAQGTQWGRGGMGNVRFSGVPLAQLLEQKGIEIGPSARFVRAEGADEPKPNAADFEHSLPLNDVLNRSLLAIQLNGQPIPAVHGGPVRLVTPGVFGTMHVKWLSHLRFETDEVRTEFQLPSYRVPKQPLAPGQKFDFTLENSNFNWNMNVKSVVLYPTTDQLIPAGKVNVVGVAFNDGQAPLETVLISWDQGDHWQPATLEARPSRFAWTTFTHSTSLKPGRHTLWARAIDQLGRSQPLDGSAQWNPRGYEWNGVEKINFQVMG